MRSRYFFPSHVICTCMYTQDQSLSDHLESFIKARNGIVRQGLAFSVNFSFVLSAVVGGEGVVSCFSSRSVSLLLPSLVGLARSYPPRWFLSFYLSVHEMDESLLRPLFRLFILIKAAGTVWIGC